MTESPDRDPRADTRPPAGLLDAVRQTQGGLIALAVAELISAESAGSDGSTSVLVEQLRSAGARVRVDRGMGRPIVLAELGGSQGPIYTVHWHGHLDSPLSRDQATVIDADRIRGRGAAGMHGAVAAMVAAAGILARAEVVGRTQRVLMTFHGDMVAPFEVIDELITSNFYGDALLSGCTCHTIGPGTAPSPALRSIPTGAPGEWRWSISATPEHPAPDMERSTLEVGQALITALQAARDPSTVQLGITHIARSADAAGRWEASGCIRGTEPSVPATMAAAIDGVADRIRAAGSIEVITRLDEIEPPFSVREDGPLIAAVRAATRMLEDREVLSRPVGQPVFLGRFTHRARMPSTAVGLDPSSVGGGTEVAAIDDLVTLARTYALATWTYLEAVSG